MINVLIALSVATISAATEVQTVVQRNGTTIATLARLHAITEQRGQDADAATARAIDQLTEPEDIYRIALLARNMTTGLAEHEAVDSVYWLAYWKAARKLAVPDDNARWRLLQELAAKSDLDGGELRAMRELLQDPKHRTLGKKD